MGSRCLRYVLFSSDCLLIPKHCKTAATVDSDRQLKKISTISRFNVAAWLILTSYHEGSLELNGVFQSFKRIPLISYTVFSSRKRFSSLPLPVQPPGYFYNSVLPCFPDRHYLPNNSFLYLIIYDTRFFPKILHQYQEVRYGGPHHSSTPPL